MGTIYYILEQNGLDTKHNQVTIAIKLRATFGRAIHKALWEIQMVDSRYDDVYVKSME